ncbi:MAG: hypothetical protein LBL93_07650 [Ruminococcus sp.]|jgi:ribosomal protein S19|nr:hypothetical protein [Ruminococcus sp.]
MKTKNTRKTKATRNFISMLIVMGLMLTLTFTVSAAAKYNTVHFSEMFVSSFDQTFAKDGKSLGHSSVKIKVTSMTEYDGNDYFRVKVQSKATGSWQDVTNQKKIYSADNYSYTYNNTPQSGAELRCRGDSPTWIEMIAIGDVTY